MFGGGKGMRRGKSALQLLEARLAHPYWLFRGRREGVPRRTLGAENVSAVSAVVLDIHRGGGERWCVLQGGQLNVCGGAYEHQAFKITSFLPS